jgi:hypothetical protein
MPGIEAILRRVASHPAGPTGLAVVCALAALPVVALTLQAYDISSGTYRMIDDPTLPSLDPGRWTAATGSVLLSALVAGTVGGFVRSRILNAEVFTFGLAWIVGIAAVPIGPFLFHQSVGFESVCVDSCRVSIPATDPTSGLLEAVLFPLGPFVESASFVALLVGFFIWCAILRRFAPVKRRVPVPPVPWASVPLVPPAAPMPAPMPAPMVGTGRPDGAVTPAGAQEDGEPRRDGY